MDRSARFWDRTASHYDQEEEKDRQTTLEMIERARKHLTSRDIVLDFGCGAGQIASEIAGNVTMIHAVDTSDRMIEIAKTKAVRRGIANIDYAHSTLFDERYQSGSFDVVLAFNILHLLEDADQAMHRINALLKPGGLLISATPCMGEQGIMSVLLSLAGKTGLTPKVRPFKIAELEETITHAGFEIVEPAGLHPRAQPYFIVARKT